MTGTGPFLNLEARLLHRDGLVLIIDKPAGLPVHAGPGGGDNLERHLSQLQYGLPRLPSLAHRLDRDTSGCLVLGRHPKALRKLGRLFSDGRVSKSYWAVVLGVPEADSGTIDAALDKRSDVKRGWRMVVSDDGQASVTDWLVRGQGNLPSGEKIAWLELTPRTGRTHQIRVHCAHLGWPVLGDPVYGGRLPSASGDEVPMHLHSRSIALPLSANKPPVTALAPVPPHMEAALRFCGWNEP